MKDSQKSNHHKKMFTKIMKLYDEFDESFQILNWTNFSIMNAL